jgi:hypothetical protein
LFRPVTRQREAASVLVLKRLHSVELEGVHQGLEVLDPGLERPRERISLPPEVMMKPPMPLESQPVVVICGAYRKLKGLCT